MKSKSMKTLLAGSCCLTSDGESPKDLLARWCEKLGYFSILAAIPTILAAQAPNVRADTVTTEPGFLGSNARPSNERSRRACSTPDFLRRRTGYQLSHQERRPDLAAQFVGGGDNCPGAPIPKGTYTSAAPYVTDGDTTGANNTVDFLVSYCYYYGTCFGYNANGPDLIYKFAITGLGASPEIKVTPTSSTYDPEIYVLEGWHVCPFQSETGNWFPNFEGLAARSDRMGPGQAEVLNSAQMNALPLNVPLYLFVDAHATGNGGGFTLRIQDATIARPPKTKFDFGGDGMADLAVFRPSEGKWYLNRWADTGTQFGLSTDKLAPADYDGDGRTDIAVFRDGAWWWINSSDATIKTVSFGQAGDIPVPADYTGDGQDELAVYRGGQWWSLDLTNGQVSVNQFGLPTDKPVVADYDGDGKMDQAIYRDGLWHIDGSTKGYMVIQFGLPTDTPVVGDYDGDGKADPAVYRSGIWYLDETSNGISILQWGLPTDIPVPGDYDRDGKTDAAVYRDGTWWLYQSSSGAVAASYGKPGDRPVPSAYLP